MKDKIEKVLIDIEEITNNNKNQKVTLVAVSKKKPASEIFKATKLGVKNFGENYLQESLPKITTLKDEKIIWHFIGKIQSNKCKDIAENFEWVHTLDRLKIAERLNKYVPKGKKLNTLIQINLDHDENKGGIDKENLDDFLCELKKFENSFSKDNTSSPMVKLFDFITLSIALYSLESQVSEANLYPCILINNFLRKIRKFVLIQFLD